MADFKSYLATKSIAPVAKTLCATLLQTVLLSSTSLAQTPPTIQRPTIDNPKISAPNQPTVGSPTGAHTKGATGTSSSTEPAKSAAKTALVTRAFDQVAYTTFQNSSAATLLVFSALGDTTWTKQAPILQTLLRESEFRNLPQFQIDMTDDELVAKFGVKAAGTLIVMKDGEERIRTTKMTKADIIRKLLRLIPAL